MRIHVVYIFTLVFLLNTPTIAQQDIEPVQREPILGSCGDIIEGEFESNYEDHFYNVQMFPGDVLRVQVIPVGEMLQTSISIKNPAETWIGISDRMGRLERGRLYAVDIESRPQLTTGMLSAEGFYSIDIANYSFPNISNTGGIGVYTIYISCTLRDGTQIRAGDSAGAQVISTPSFSGFGFPGLAPIDFNLAMTTGLNAGTTNGRIPPGVGAIFGYTFNGNAGDEIELSFTRTGGNLNLGVVVLSADNQVVFQASLTQGDTLTTRFILPTTGEYIIGVSEISLIPPASPEPTSFEIMTSIN